MYFQNKPGSSFAIQSNVYGPPPPYEKARRSPSKWLPKNWSKKVRIGVAFAVASAIVIAAVAGVYGSRADAYPDYYPLKYNLTDTYSGTDFFDQFDYFTGYDPSSGFVHYVPQATAQQYNLTYASSDAAVLRVDTTTKNASTGRFSVRITSKKQYESGLFIFDILNSPYGCSTWPALWLSDPNNWPYNGRSNHLTFDECSPNVKQARSMSWKP